VLERNKDLRVSESFESVTREREREDKCDLEGKWQNLLNLEECGSVR